jgi:predicted AlkP superfamily phosphohydrolase/phosphomutase
MASRILILGLDGGTFDVIRPLANEGRLPVIASMLAGGAHGILRSTVPPATPAAWTSFATGKNPGKHGVFDFNHFDRSTRRFLPLHEHRHNERLVWQLLGNAGLRSIVLDVPFTHPPRPFNGLMIPGYGTPRTPGTVLTHPTDLAERIPHDLVSEVRVALPENPFERSEAFIAKWRQIMAGRRRLLQHLIREEPWDLLMAVFSITDNMAHVFWTYIDRAHPNYYRPEADKFRSAFFGAYEMCDQLIGELRERAGPDAVTLVISDHGFGSVYPRQYLFRRLAEGGYLSLRRPSLGRLVNTYLAYPRLREWVKNLASARRNRIAGALRRSALLPGSRAVDVARSRVLLSGFGLCLWINDALADGPEKEALLIELDEFLTSDADPSDGRPIINGTNRGAEVYKGPYAERGPDLIAAYTNFFRPEAAAPAQNPRVEGGHTPEGILLAAGPHIRPGAVPEARLVDLAPTILHLAGLPVPEDMDGRVLEVLFSEEGRTEKQVRSEAAAAGPDARQESGDAGYSPEEQAEVENQLRQLGYLD